NCRKSPSQQPKTAKITLNANPIRPSTYFSGKHYINRQYPCSMPDETNSKMFLGYAPITFVRREGNTVYPRLLHPDERPEAARPVTIQEGDQLVFEHGALPITVDMLDTPAVAGRGGYAPVTGTVWRCNISLLTTHSDHHRRRLFELSRKLDVTFFLWSSVMSMLEKQSNESEPVTRLHIGLNAHALTEEMFVPLAQTLKIAREFSKNYSLDMPVALEDACEGIVSLRKARYSIRS
ncbi:MAG: hypothetical protein OXM02_04590, partial [Bacteroidota bacterium]|nr:hypothetical protein [Bacteroidota bacterium]